MKRINIKCPYCGSRAYLQPSSVVYGDRADDVEAKLYVCARYPACDAYVAAHKDTLLPMGTLADRNLRRKRMEGGTFRTEPADLQRPHESKAGIPLAPDSTGPAGVRDTHR